MEELKQNKEKRSEKILQWHPAFYASIQIELKDDAENLIFENEHQLGTKPMGVDVLIIKKQVEKPIQKNIGRIFRKYNIIEYKGPGDYLSIDDFYKVYGYVCFYKSDVEKVNSIRIDELTISLVSESYPRKLIRHLREERGFIVEQKENGIYVVIGDKIPMQIIVTSQLSRSLNLWLKSLSAHLSSVEDAKELLEEYREYRDNTLYSSIMNIVVEANRKKFEEANMVCDALMEIMKEQLEEKMKEQLEEKMKEQLDAKKNEGERRVNNLVLKLSALGRAEDIIKAASDSEYQKRLFEEFQL